METDLQGAFQDIFFITTLDKTSKLSMQCTNLQLKLGYPTEDIGIYIQPQHMGTSVHLEFNLSYNPDNAKEVKKPKPYMKKQAERCQSLADIMQDRMISWAGIQLNKDADLMKF